MTAKKSASDDMSFSFTVDATPAQVFKAVSNVRGWWSDTLEGTSDKLGAKFKYAYKDIHESTQTITEYVPNKKIVWRISKSSLSFLKDKSEWDGTEVVFEIAKKGDKTELRFKHVGLTPDVECYDACFEGWGYYIKKSLPSLIKTGKGKLNPGW